MTVCATLTFLGATTSLECSITVYLDTTNRKAGTQPLGQYNMYWYILFTDLFSVQSLVLTFPIPQCSPSPLTLDRLSV